MAAKDTFELANNVVHQAQTIPTPHASQGLEVARNERMQQAHPHFPSCLARDKSAHLISGHMSWTGYLSLLPSPPTWRRYPALTPNGHTELKR